MTVYVDELRVYGPTALRIFQGGSAHLTADTLEELHAFARQDLAAEVGQWIVRGKRPPLPLVGRLVEAVLGAARGVVRRVG